MPAETRLTQTKREQQIATPPEPAPSAPRQLLPTKPPQKDAEPTGKPRQKDAVNKSLSKPDAASKSKKAAASKQPPNKKQDADGAKKPSEKDTANKQTLATSKPPPKKSTAGKPSVKQDPASKPLPKKAATNPPPQANDGVSSPQQATRNKVPNDMARVDKPSLDEPPIAKKEKRKRNVDGSKTQPAAKKSKDGPASAPPEGTSAKTVAAPGNPEVLATPKVDKRAAAVDASKPDAKRRRKDEAAEAAIGGKLREIAERPKPESKHQSSELKRLSYRKTTDDIIRASVPEEVPDVLEFPFVHAGVNYSATTKGRQDWFLHLTSPEHTAGLCNAVATLPQRLSDECIARLREAAASTDESPAALVTFTGVLLLVRRLPDMNLCKPADAKKIASSANTRVASLKSSYGHLALVPAEGCSSASWWDLHSVVDACLISSSEEAYYDLAASLDQVLSVANLFVLRDWIWALVSKLE